MDGSSSSQNFIDSILVRIFILVVVFSSIVLTAKADNGKGKSKKETKLALSMEEVVFFDAISEAVEQKANRAIFNALHHQKETIRVIDASGKVVLETTEVREVPANAEKLMNQGKIAFYIVNL
ncbi:MAG: hypothetical protein EAZ08_10575 [Cytophagales bacterium]|nr:MAG: hypothetical protein EAZ08_10575 [Cytophagales bacterium]